MRISRVENTNVPDYRLFQLEQIAGKALQGAEDCVSGRRVDIERLMQTKYGLHIEAFHGLKTKYDTMGFVMAQENKVYIDAEMMDDDDQERKYRFTLAEELAGSAGIKVGRFRRVEGGPPGRFFVGNSLDC